MSTSPPIPTPLHLGGFEIIRRLGTGGMAEVFVAKKVGAEGIVKILVVKRILSTHHTSRRFRAMFIDEAQLAIRLNHPNIVQIYDFQDAGDEGLLLSMEYVEGTDLGKLASTARSKGAAIPPWISAYIVAETAKGLHYAHERKEGGKSLDIVHRDVSPQNILLSYDGTAKIADFGIATANLFREDKGVLKGKYGYMSPEQARGEKVDRRSDVYSLGIVLYELLAGRPLHGGLVGEPLLLAVREGVVEPPSTYALDVPKELETIVMRALAPARADRFQTARDLGAAIMRALFQRQELVDASAVEATIHQLIGPSENGEGREAAPSPRARASPVPFGPPSRKSNAPRADERNSRHRRGERAQREVRHVAVVGLHLYGLEELEREVGQSRAWATGDKIRRTFDDIAYKRGARWTWESKDKALATVGLLSHPGRAAVDAALLALDIHEALATAYDDLRDPVRVSMSIARGVARGERDRLGHLVRHELQANSDEMASLIADKAPSGGTWVTGGVYRLIRREFRWSEAPIVNLRAEAGEAMPASMHLYALERSLSREERLEEMALGSGDLVGRGSEKADLHAAYHRAVREPPRVIARALIGEVGIGKSALVSAFLAELPEEARVVRIECSPARSEVLYGDISELVRELTQIPATAPPSEIVSHIHKLVEPVAGAQTGPLALAMAELITGHKLRESEDEDASYRKRLVFDGVQAIIAALSAERPLVIVIDALQFLHESGLELIAKLLRREFSLPVLALFVSRPEARILPYLENVVRSEIHGLSPDEQVRLLERHLGVEEGVRELCSDIIAKVAGNPFFLLEMVDAMLERGTFEIRRTGEGGRQVLLRLERGGEREQPLPSTLEQLLSDKLRELPRAERMIVDLLAVAASPLALPELTRLSRLGGETEEVTEKLLARGICEPKGEAIDLRYPLARDVAYQGIAPAERAALHRRLAAHLEATPLAKGLSSAIVARHFELGGEATRAAELYLEAGAAARSSLQSRHSIRHFHRALALLDEGDPRRLVAHEALEAIFRVLGRRRERREHLSSLRAFARKTEQSEWVALALLRTARQSLDEGFLSSGASQAQQAERVAKLAQSKTLEVQAQALLGELLGEIGDLRGALASCERALATASDPDIGARLRGEVIRTRGVLLRRVGRVREASQSHVEAIRLFRSTGAKRQEARAKNALAYSMFVLGRYEDAISLARDSIAIDLAIGSRFQLAKTATNIGNAYAQLGDIERALAYLSRARALHERYGDQDSRADTLLVSAEVLVEQGDLDAAQVFCDEAASLNAITKNGYDLVHEWVVRALLARARGDAEATVRYATLAREVAFGPTLVSFTVFASALEAAARVDLGDHATGARLAYHVFQTVEAMEGTEFGLEIRDLSADALAKAGSENARGARARAAAHARQIESMIRDSRLRDLFLLRAIVTKLLSDDEFPGGHRGA